MRLKAALLRIAITPRSASLDLRSVPFQSFDFLQKYLLVPLGSTTNVVRSQNFIPFHSDWPIPRVFIRVELVSASRSIVKANLVQKLLCDTASSALTPTTLMPAASKSARLAVKDLPCTVQPGVSSFG